MLVWFVCLVGNYSITISLEFTFLNISRKEQYMSKPAFSVFVLLQKWQTFFADYCMTIPYTGCFHLDSTTAFKKYIQNIVSSSLILALDRQAHKAGFFKLFSSIIVFLNCKFYIFCMLESFQKGSGHKISMFQDQYEFAFCCCCAYV